MGKSHHFIKGLPELDSRGALSDRTRGLFFFFFLHFHLVFDVVVLRLWVVELVLALVHLLAASKALDDLFHHVC